MALAQVFLRVLRFFVIVLLLYLGQAGGAREPSNKQCSGGCRTFNRKLLAVLCCVLLIQPTHRW